MDKALEIPRDIAAALSQANLSYAVEILVKGNAFNHGNQDIGIEILSANDITLLMPNSAAAVSHFNTTGKSQSDIFKQIQYHTLDRLLYSTDFVNGTELMTRAGFPILVTVGDDGTVYINTAKVTSVDYFTANGAFHIIDE